MSGSTGPCPAGPPQQKEIGPDSGRRKSSLLATKSSGKWKARLTSGISVQYWCFEDHRRAFNVDLFPLVPSRFDRGVKKGHGRSIESRYRRRSSFSLLASPLSIIESNRSSRGIQEGFPAPSIPSSRAGSVDSCLERIRFNFSVPLGTRPVSPPPWPGMTSGSIASGPPGRRCWPPSLSLISPGNPGKGNLKGLRGGNLFDKGGVHDEQPAGLRSGKNSSHDF